MEKGQRMKLPLQVTFQNISPSEALEAAIRERAAKLDKFHPHLLSCRVVVSGETKRRLQGNHFSVRLDVKTKGHEVAVTKEHDEDAFVAVRDAFDAAKRQLEDLARERRGDVKTHVPAEERARQRAEALRLGEAEEGGAGETE